MLQHTPRNFTEIPNRINLEPDKSANLTSCCQEAVEISAREKMDVSFHFNGRDYLVKYRDLEVCLREI